MGSEVFTEAWNILNPMQKQASEWDRGSLLVLAGPGSGKTSVLTCRIARILNETPNKNFRILGLTFTNKAADEMRTRVNELVPGQEKRLFLGTFHSFCASILRQHGNHIKINSNFRIYSEQKDLIAILGDAVEKAKEKSDLVIDLDKKALPTIQGLQSHLVFAEDSQGIQDYIKKNRALESLGKRLTVIYPAYEVELKKRNALDFNSLILKAYELLKKFPILAQNYRIVYPYICIDEFQDTNNSQYDFIRLLVGATNPNLFVVADDDQIIYQWNGASHQRISQLKEDYKPEVIQLPINYRCPAKIVRLANNLIQYNFSRDPEKQPLEAFKSDVNNEAVRLKEFSSFDFEVDWVAEDIKKNYSSEYGSVTILARNRRLLEKMREALNRQHISAIIYQRKNEFESPPFIWLHSLLHLSNDRQDRDSLEAVCAAFEKLTNIAIDPDIVMRFANSSNHDYLRHWLALTKENNPNSMARTIIDYTEKSLGEGMKYQEFSQFALDWFENLTSNNEEFFTRYDEEKKVWSDLVREIRNTLSTNITLEAFLQELQMRSLESKPDPNTVNLRTVHGSKGKEFDHVYLIGVVDDEFPSYYSKNKGEKSLEMEEERRNFYVAITRTKKTLTLSYSKQYKNFTKQPSRFLSEMGLL
ncbi:MULTISPECIES: ATP-dependent helicase [Spirulina sp. CCY15215]|uniref:ATP-dependent helicase n=1 Tax=Spirulina sp. CCY15215 TaxID=2767591 RepID=UPI00194E289B|nr:ATP-dependent helicase [Spirulina major]